MHSAQGRKQARALPTGCAAPAADTGQCTSAMAWPLATQILGHWVSGSLSENQTTGGLYM